MMTKKLNVKVFSDGAVLETMLKDLQTGLVTGFTTNPSLMKKAGISSYIGFAKEVLAKITDYPVSFEVFADDLASMEKEAEKIASLGDNVYVKIPVTTSTGESTCSVIQKLSAKGIKLNVTAIFTIEQTQAVVDHLTAGVPAIVSVFAGRIADTGVDPMPIMEEALRICLQKEGVELLWASPRETYNIYQADQLGVDIITCTTDLIAKLPLQGKDLEDYSLETVQMFLKDSTSLGFKILEDDNH
ncbi:TPA: transaldolase [Streptococcus pyogenes]|uniref:Transaldolase n=1 Tax=Streptococcus pyogenes serotype M12 (strain MGAS9429) TaxID=370551 RepID=Q1JJX4_STRPC|nr:transaldolase [Streptococcus pyogenes]ABF36736.1 Transaldolase [Streptococcus pyogenes MGAS2096]MDV6872487.1 transaldolase [Pseudomonas aeruginosa]HEP6153066.1 transaldolase [Streptococcus pyogenes ABC020047615]HEP6175702.1 transaldolase [Streptococcus pyogenes ABC020056755]HEP6180973.1 transaldolase [Streptococcus pyogenes ABC020057019]HEP6184442.1 transaldolase [Streptococcus pyogenes ABC020061794]HEP6186018.1 transaldolase [Streptococcus pyogenes ABC020040056]HEP6191227.1 transaldolas